MEVDVLERFYAVTNEALEEAKNEVSLHASDQRRVSDLDNM